VYWRSHTQRYQCVVCFWVYNTRRINPKWTKFQVWRALIFPEQCNLLSPSAVMWRRDTTKNARILHLSRKFDLLTLLQFTIGFQVLVIPTVIRGSSISACSPTYRELNDSNWVCCVITEFLLGWLSCHSGHPKHNWIELTLWKPGQLPFEFQTLCSLVTHVDHKVRYHVPLQHSGKTLIHTSLHNDPPATQNVNTLSFKTILQNTVNF